MSTQECIHRKVHRVPSRWRFDSALAFSRTCRTIAWRVNRSPQAQSRWAAEKRCKEREIGRTHESTQCLSKEGLAKHNTQQPPFYSTSGLYFKVQQVVMPESLKGRFTLRSHCKDDSPSLFNQVICLGKLIWRLCMFFFIAAGAVQTLCKCMFTEAEDIQRHIGFFCCRMFQKKLCTKRVKVQCCCFISTLCVCGETISLKTCSLPITKNLMWNEWQCEVLADRGVFSPAGAAWTCSASLADWDWMSPLRDKLWNFGLELGTADCLFDQRPAAALHSLTFNTPALSPDKQHAVGRFRFLPGKTSTAALRGSTVVLWR